MSAVLILRSSYDKFSCIGLMIVVFKTENKSDKTWKSILDNKQKSQWYTLYTTLHSYWYTRRLCYQTIH